MFHVTHVHHPHASSRSNYKALLPVDRGTRARVPHSSGDGPPRVFITKRVTWRSCTPCAISFRLNPTRTTGHHARVPPNNASAPVTRDQSIGGVETQILSITTQTAEVSFPLSWCNSILDLAYRRHERHRYQATYIRHHRHIEWLGHLPPAGHG